MATVGEFSKLRVAEQSGSSYLWKYILIKYVKSGLSSDAEFVGVNTGSEVIVKWNNRENITLQWTQ